jgi:riboflavin kinase/FMN adenylyltransferase
LRDGRPREAARLLGRAWEIEGLSRGSDDNGGILGCPRAILTYRHVMQPKPGLYAVRAGLDKGPDTLWLDGLAIFHGGLDADKASHSLDVYLFDTNPEFCATNLRVALIDYIGAERIEAPETREAQFLTNRAKARAILHATI